MRQGQQNKRMRGRNRKGPNPLTRSFESNGPDVKIRGTALHIAEKYVQLARDAQSSGDRIASESYLQHAEHYYRIVAAAQAQMPQPQQITRSDDDDGDDDDDRSFGDGDRPQQAPQSQSPSVGLADPQPYVNGNGQTRAESSENGNGGADEGREPRENREQGNPRGRRRRPYRDRSNGEQGEVAAADAAAPAAVQQPVVDTASSDD